MRRRAARTVAAVAVTAGLLAGGATAVPAATGSLETLTGLLDTGSALLGVGDQVQQGRFASIPNFRDAAGDGRQGYLTADGQRMRQGLFYRADNLAAISDGDMDGLVGLGITTIFDLRTDREVDDAPDMDVDGAARTHLPIDAGAALLEDFEHMTEPAEAYEFMREMNRSFVRDAQSRQQFATLLQGLADGEGPFLYHCTSGKDRTGWTSMLLQHIAGVPDDIIMRDYLLTNDYIADTVQPALDRIEAAGLEPEIVRPMITVDASFLQAGLEAVAEDYGDIDAYLTEGLGLTDETIARLRAALLA